MTVVDLRLAHPESELTDIGDAACWSATGMLAAGRWDSGYVENDWSSGTIELVDLEGRPVADFGIDVLAGEMACLTDGRIAFTRYVKDFDTIVPDSVTLTIAKPDGSMHDITQDPLWVLGADAAL